MARSVNGPAAVLLSLAVAFGGATGASAARKHKAEAAHGRHHKAEEEDAKPAKARRHKLTKAEAKAAEREEALAAWGEPEGGKGRKGRRGKETVREAATRAEREELAAWGEPKGLSKKQRAAWLLREKTREREDERQAASAGKRAKEALAKAKRPPAPPSVRQREVVVEDGDSVFDLAGRFGVSVRAIAELNGLKAPYEPAPGTRLKIPPATGAQLAAARPPAGATPTPPRLVAPPAASPPQVAAAPRPPAATPASPPPAVIAIARPPSASPGYTVLGDSRGGANLPAEPPPTLRRGARTEADALAAVAVASTRAPAPMTSSEGGRGRFAWPLTGAVLSGFGAKGPGLRNDGLDLAAKPGEPVRASAAGEVVYAGKEIAAFGNLVLLKHAGGWVTAYAHLGHIDVAMRQTVTQGQSIGEAAGEAGAAEAPRVHFEVRAPSAQGAARPIDPASVLPPV